MEKQKNIPVLRFPEFDYQWQENRLVNLFVEFKSGYGITSTNIFDKGEYPVYGGNGLRGYTNQFTHEGFYLLIGRQGALCGNVNRSFGKAYISEHAIACKANESSDTEWLAQRLSYYNLNRLSESSAQPGLSVNKLLRFKIIVPTLPEQQKIATFFTAIDQKISQLKKKHQLLEQYKKGVMQKIFSQQIRFNDDDGMEFPKWEKKRLGEVLYEHKTLNSKGDFKEVFSVAKHKGVINQIEHLGRSFSAKDVSNYKVIYPNDIVYTKSPTSDFPFGIIKQNLTSRTGIVSPLYGVFRPVTGDLGFLLHNFFLSWVNTYNYLNPLVQKGAKNTMNINNKDFLNGARITLPVSEKEQTKIANFLSSIDNKIQYTQVQIERAEQWKKGLMQKMFV
jgi:type I restriction enzyme S subunit